MHVTLKILDRENNFKAGAYFENDINSESAEDLFNSCMEEFDWESDQSMENAISILLESLYEIRGFDEDIGLTTAEIATHDLIINNKFPKCSDEQKGIITASQEIFEFWDSISDIHLSKACADIELE